MRGTCKRQGKLLTGSKCNPKSCRLNAEECIITRHKSNHRPLSQHSLWRIVSGRRTHNYRFPSISPSSRYSAIFLKPIMVTWVLVPLAIKALMMTVERVESSRIESISEKYSLTFSYSTLSPTRNSLSQFRLFRI